MSHHAGKLDKSQRLWKVYNFLKRRGTRGASTIEVNEYCDSTRASSDISDLRRSLTNSLVECKFEGISREGRKIHRFTLVPK